MQKFAGLLVEFDYSKYGLFLLQMDSILCKKGIYIFDVIFLSQTDGHFPLVESRTAFNGSIDFIALKTKLL